MSFTPGEYFHFRKYNTKLIAYCIRGVKQDLQVFET